MPARMGCEPLTGRDIACAVYGDPTRLLPGPKSRPKRFKKGSHRQSSQALPVPAARKTFPPVFTYSASSAAFSPVPLATKTAS